MKFPNNLRTLRNQKGLQQIEVAKGVGLKQPEYSKMERGERRIGHHVENICKFYKVDVDAIYDQFVDVPSRSRNYSEDLPVFGLPRLNGEGIQMHNKFVSHTFRPDYLMNNTNAYACFVNGEEMLPRYDHGNLLYVDPLLKYEVGDYVVVQIKIEDKLVGIFRKLIEISDRQMKFETLNPIKEDVLKNFEIEAVHCIVGSRTKF